MGDLTNAQLKVITSKASDMKRIGAVVQMHINEMVNWPAEHEEAREQVSQVSINNNERMYLPVIEN